MIEEYWNELNKIYGTNFEFPKEDLSDNRSEEIEARIICGESIDAAIQSTF